MRPLHRLAEWEPSGTRVLTVTTLLTWALAALTQHSLPGLDCTCRWLPSCNFSFRWVQ